MTVKTSITLLLSTAVFGTATAQIATAHEWAFGNSYQKVFTINQNASPAKGLVLNDGGFLLSGSHTDGSFTSGFLTRLNDYGRIAWSRGYSRTEGDYAIGASAELADRSVVALADQFDGRAGLLRVNRFGATISQKIYSITDGALNFSIVKPLSNGGFIVAGTATDANFNGTTLIARFNSNGNLAWKKMYETNGNRNAPTALAISGDNIYVAGVIPTTDFVAADTLFMLKLNVSNGNVTKSRKYWLNENAIFYSGLVVRSDNQLVLAASFSSQTTGQTTNYIMQANTSLEMVKVVQPDNAPDGQFAGIVATDDKGVALAYNDVFGEFGYLIKMNRQLQPVFTRYYEKDYHGTHAYRFNDIDYNACNGGFVLSGARNFADSGVVYFVKTDKYGKTGSCNALSLNLTVATRTLDGNTLFCSNVYNAELVQESNPVPGNALPKLEETLCGGSSFFNAPVAGETVAAGDVAEATVPATNFTVMVRNNPTTNYFTLNLSGTENKTISIRVSDISGRFVEQLQTRNGMNIQLGQQWNSGVYMAEVTQGAERRVLRLVKM